MIDKKGHRQYSCGHLVIKELRKIRKELLVSQRNYINLDKWVRTNRILNCKLYSKVIYNLNLKKMSRLIRFVNVCLAFEIGIPLSRIESIPGRNRYKRRVIYLDKLIGLMKERFYGDDELFRNVKYTISSLSCNKKTSNDFLDWLSDSGVEYKELKSISYYNIRRYDAKNIRGFLFVNTNSLVKGTI